MIGATSPPRASDERLREEPSNANAFSRTGVSAPEATT
jgi:hypothetical protein